MHASRPAADEAHDRFEMANLSPMLTALPMIVRSADALGTTPREGEFGARGRAHPNRTAPVSGRPTVEVVAGPELDRRDTELVRQWIEVNREAILAYWNGDLLTDELVTRLKPVASP
jgi:hypothetical protein